MADITLSSAVRTSLLSLKNTTDLIGRTQNRLSTGLSVAGPIDDPVAYFQAKGLSDRSADFQEKKSNIDQGISSLSTALNGLDGVESLVKQLKGLALNAKSATSSQIGGLVSQFNDLRNQLNYLAEDTQYQGLNLIAGTGQSLTVDFSNVTSSILSVNSVDTTTGRQGLNILKAVTSRGDFNVNFEGNSGGTIAGSDTISVSLASTATTLASGTYTFAYGDQTISVTVGSAGNTGTSFTTTQTVADGNTYVIELHSSGYTDLGRRVTSTGATQNSNDFTVEFASVTAQTLSAGSTISVELDGLTASTLASGSYTFSYGGQTLSFSVGSAGDTGKTFTTTTDFAHTSAPLTLTIATGVATAANAVFHTAGVSAGLTADVTGQVYATSGGKEAFGALFTNASNSFSVGEVTGQYVVDAGIVSQINSLINRLDTALGTLRSDAQTLGSNVALLQTRLDFTKSYVNTLTAGAGKLTLADLNEEGANLLALQTRQQLGIQALSFANQAEQSILTLFR